MPPRGPVSGKALCARHPDPECFDLQESKRDQPHMEAGTEFHRGIQSAMSRVHCAELPGESGQSVLVPRLREAGGEQVAMFRIEKTQPPELKRNS